MTEKTSPSSNVYLFYGEDDFSLRRKIDRWRSEFAKKYSASSVSFFDAENIAGTELVSQLQDHLAPSLFSNKKLIVIRNGLPSNADQTVLAEFLLTFARSAPADYFIVFWQSKIDRRLGFTKKFLALVNLVEFNLPHGLVLNGWIKAMAKTLGSEITDEAAERLAQFLGRDLYEEKKAGGRVIERKEAFDLWQAYSEVLKLSSNTMRIEPVHVNSLVRPKISDDVFALTDELINGNQKGAFQALENFLATSETAEKTSFIKIIGLLSDQMRSLLVASLLLASGNTNEQIAEKLGWSPGRVFITAKNLKNISVAKLKQLLGQLLMIDQRIKSSDVNATLEIDLFLATATG